LIELKLSARSFLADGRTSGPLRQYVELV